MARTRGRGWVRRVTELAAVSTFVQIVLGAGVRTSSSGLGCGEQWPVCRNSFAPPVGVHPLVEYMHRVVGSLTGLFIVALCILAWWGRDWMSREARPYATIAVGLVALEGVLGGLAVLFDLPDWLVAVHLLVALVILALLLGLRMLEREHVAEWQATRGQRVLAWGILGWTFVVLATGALVTATGATEYCAGWPFCASGARALGDPLAVLQLMHRAAAGVLAGLLLWLACAGWRVVGREALMRRVTWFLGGVVVVQVLIGAGLGLLDQPDLLQGIHVALATTVWSAVVVWAALVRKPEISHAASGTQLAMEHGGAAKN